MVFRIMKKSILELVEKCNKCGKAFLVNIEGDLHTCDYCLAEDEMMNLKGFNDESGLDKVS